MSDFESYEYVIKPRKDGKNRTKRTLLVLLYIVFIFAWLFFGLLTRILIPLLALIPLTTWMLVFATWRFVNVEYEYVIESGVITFSRIYGGRSRRAAMEFDIRDAERILPLTAKSTSRLLDDFDPTKEYSFIDSPDSPDALIALCSDENGNHITVAFTADDRLKRVIRLYNPAAVRSADLPY
jgi:hypothetical protein